MRVCTDVVRQRFLVGKLRETDPVRGIVHHTAQAGQPPQGKFGNRRTELSLCETSALWQSHNQFSVIRSGFQLPADEDSSADFSVTVVSAAGNQRIPIIVFNRLSGDFPDASYPVASKRYYDMIPWLDLFNQATVPRPAAAFGFPSDRRASRWGLAFQAVAPLAAPAYRGALIHEPALPHARERVLHAIDFPGTC